MFSTSILSYSIGISSERLEALTQAKARLAVARRALMKFLKVSQNPFTPKRQRGFGPTGLLGRFPDQMTPYGKLFGARDRGVYRAVSFRD